MVSRRGPFYDPESWVSANPSAYLKGRKAPVLIVLAERERWNPPILGQARNFVSAARAQGNGARYLVLPGLRHVTTMPALGDTSHAGLKAVVEFIRDPARAVQERDVDVGSEVC